ncbi:hypothetical protein GGH12_005109 [Coemansia sp. RSA 1822]|nr:hypothetical protein LPJ76_005154 [Coemansia sp. RSA 638]KAJ2539374.1 hypothetical protein GGF49_005254 [Coemansia sp. RSA 1853]KAJ2560083.1 hypothetical protein GGH12_005109 [Coemansia sp. RSA 1822]
MWLLARSTRRAWPIVRLSKQGSGYARAKSTSVVAWGAFVDRFATSKRCDTENPYLEAHARSRPTQLALDRVFGGPVDANIQISAMGAGMGHALVAGTVLSNGKLQTKLAGFGLNESYQLGNAHIDATIDRFGKPVVSPVDGTVEQIACGREHSAMVVKGFDGARRVLVCGNNAYGQLGLGSLSPKSSDGLRRHALSELSMLDDMLSEGEEPVKVQCGLDHTVILTNKGRVFAMGWGDDGQLGTGLQASADQPMCVVSLEETPIADISSSTDFTLALSVDGRVFYWGNAEYGQCMVGKKIDKILTRMEVPFDNNRVKGIAAGGCHSLLLTEAGQVFVCGYGALGLGPDHISTLQPTPIKGFGNIEAIFASTDRCLAVDREHHVYSWGLGNSAGRLGDGTVATNAFTPTLISTDHFSPADPCLVALGNDIALIASL